MSGVCRFFAKSSGFRLDPNDRQGVLYPPERKNPPEAGFSEGFGACNLLGLQVLNK